MSFEEEFDGIIRRKAEEEHYPFDQTNWDKASNLLEAERKALQATRLKKLILPSVFTIVLGASALVAFNYFNTANTTVEIAEVKTSVPSTEQTLTPEKENAGTSAANNNSNNNSAPNTVNSASKSELILTNTKASVASDATALPANYPATEPGTKSKSPQDETTSTSQAPSEKYVSENSSASQPLAKGKDNTTPMKSSGANPEIAPGEERPLGNDVAAEPGSAQENENVLNSAAAEQLMADELSAVYSTLPYEITDAEIMPTSFTYLERYDDYYAKKSKTHYMNVELGGNYLLGWDAKNGKDGQGLNWYAGINYGFYLCNKVSIGIGVQAYNVSNIREPFYLVTSKDYGFGSKNIYTRVTSNQLYYVGAPLKINYAINKTNIIGLGFHAAYLVAANSNVSKYYIQDSEEISVVPAETNNKEIYKGTSIMNMMLSAHYKTQFGKRIGLNLEFNYGLTDLFENTADIKTVEKPMGVRLGLTYTLFDK